MSKDKVKDEIEKHEFKIRDILFQHLELDETVSEIVKYVMDCETDAVKKTVKKIRKA